EVSKTAYDKAKADKVRAAKNLNYAEIYSPIDGIVISREVEVGQTVVSNMNVANLYTIADLDNMQVIGNVDEADIGQVKVGQAVTFSVDAYSDELFEGHVTQVRLNPTVESNVVTYEVVVAAPNPDHKLIPGLTANLIIYTMSEDNVLLLPTKAFMFTPQINDDDNLPKPDGDAGKLVLGDGQKCVWVVKDGRLVPTVVTVGASNGLKTVIHEGLSDNDAVASGYSVSAGSQEGERSEGERSPFAPQPPGRNKKK
ncbi:efflux RND transporter periplasmic adaptor subunit, partial [uncultured Duncaniella sp.]